MRSRDFLTILMILVFFNQGYSQEYSWNGDAGTSDFFDENNWSRTSDGTPPGQGEIDPATPIDLELILSGSANAEGTIQFGSGSLTINNGELNATDITGGTLNIGNKGYIHLSGSVSILENTDVKFSDPLGWIKAPNVRPKSIHDQLLKNITYQEKPGVYPEVIRLDNYYSGGTLIRPNDSNAEPLKIYSLSSLNGTGTGITPDSVYSGDNIPAGLNNNIGSFRLSRGYMLTMSVEPDGTGNSKVFVASEDDLVVEILPGILSGGVSFIRVIPWNWVSKRGTGGAVLGLDNTWYYRWSNSDVSDLQREYAPMAWGHTSADDDEDIKNYRSKYKVTHVMGFNEADNCNDQSGQYGNLCIPDTAVMLYRNLMKTGLRLVSPGCREGAWDDWLDEFNRLATEKDIRIDVIAVHWYDWGSNPQNSPNADPQMVFNRFKNYLSRVYEHYGLPIWITEFNANTNRNTWVHLEFMKLAVPYLESLGYVERYCWFEPVSDVADYYNTNGSLTPIGEYYKSEPTAPAIPGDYWTGSDNLSVVNSITPENHAIAPGISVYPNPAEETLNISSETAINEISVYDLTGKEVTFNEKPADRVYVGDLTPGIYFIRINRSVSKFIKL